MLGESKKTILWGDTDRPVVLFPIFSIPLVDKLVLPLYIVEMQNWFTYGQCPEPPQTWINIFELVADGVIARLFPVLTKVAELVVIVSFAKTIALLATHYQ